MNSTTARVAVVGGVGLGALILIGFYFYLRKKLPQSDSEPTTTEEPGDLRARLLFNQSWDDDAESSDLAVGETIKNLSNRGPLAFKKPAPKPSPQLKPPADQAPSEPNEPPAPPEERSTARKPGRNRVQFAEQISKSKIIEDLPATLSTANGAAASNGAAGLWGSGSAGGSAAAAVAAAAGTVGVNAGIKKPAAGPTLVLEVIAGPATGTKFTLRVDSGQLDCTIGRVKSNDLHLNDGEVSSKHAIVRWNEKAHRWEVIDRGSLNGTLLNEAAINLPENEDGDRVHGPPHALSDGDVITCGSESRVVVRLVEETHEVERVCPAAPFPVAISLDPMKGRRGGKALPMEDVPHCEWPLRGFANVGIFCVFDGHAGRACAENVKRMFPEQLSAALDERGGEAKLRVTGDATETLRAAFKATEKALPNEDEGCTATVLLVWRSLDGSLRLQVGNLGDSHCVLSQGSSEAHEVTVLTEDHRLTGPVEKKRLEAMGKPLREGDTRLCGMNIARVFGDKFLKAQNVGMSSEPFIHPPLSLPPTSTDDPAYTPCIAVIASDGLWDVMSPKRAIQLAHEARTKCLKSRGTQCTAEAMSSTLVIKAKAAKTQDNTTVVAVDFTFD